MSVKRDVSASVAAARYGHNEPSLSTDPYGAPHLYVAKVERILLRSLPIPNRQPFPVRTVVKSRLEAIAPGAVPGGTVSATFQIRVMSGLARRRITRTGPGVRPDRR